ANEFAPPWDFDAPRSPMPRSWRSGITEPHRRLIRIHPIRTPDRHTFHHRLCFYPDIREGNGARMRLEADEARISVFALLPAPEFLARVRGVCGKRCGRLSVQQHLVCAISDFDLVGMPRACGEPL